MHSTLVRAQNVFGFFTTVAFCTAILTALSTLIIPQNPHADIELRNVQVYVERQISYPKIFLDSTDSSNIVSRVVHITTPPKKKNTL